MEYVVVFGKRKTYRPMAQSRELKVDPICMTGSLCCIAEIEGTL